MVAETELEQGRALDAPTAQLAQDGRVPNHLELIDRLLLELLRGRPDPTEALRSAQLLGVDLHRPRAVILIDASDFILAADGAVADRDPRARRSLARARRAVGTLGRFFGGGSEAVAGYIGDGEVAVLKERDEDRLTPARQPGAEPPWDGLIPLKRTAEDLLCLLRRETAAEVAAGVGRYHPGVEGLARSYDDAAAAVRICRRFCEGGHAHALDGLGVEALVGGADEATRASLALRLLAPLQREPELLETLETYFAEDRQPARTARRLAIHRNTLGYRLDKAAALTGLDPRRFDDAVQLRLAFVLRGLRSEPIPLCSRPTGGRVDRADLAPRPMNGATAIS
jgi:carbohydrate diacid regulator